MPDTNPISANGSPEREQRIRQVIRECIHRRGTGEKLTDQFLAEAHPELMPELAARLSSLRLIESAQLQIDTESDSCHALHIRCPDCHASMAWEDGSRLPDLICSTCGAAIRLIDDAGTTEAQRIKQVGQFRLLEMLGAGAFATVWSAHDTELNRSVAVKIPHQGQLSAEETERFIREARTSAQLTHTNIVRVYEVGREDDRVYIVTALIEGRNLADWLDQQQPTTREAAQLCATIAEALHYAHEHGVIHRDLKPSNIMVGPDGEPHLLDFGLAKCDVGEAAMTADGKLVGTPAYMSPEQAGGRAYEADRRSDVYSVGVILYELLTGERPFRGTTRMLLHQVLIEDPPPPRKLNSAVPKDLETVCLKCLEKDSKRRYQTAQELADDLHRYLNGRPVRARPITRVGRGCRWCKRNPLLASSLAGLLLAIVVGGVGITSFAIQADAERNQARRSRTLLDRQRYLTDMRMAQHAWETSRVRRCRELLDRHIPQGDKPGLRSFEWHYLSRLCTANQPDRTIGEPTGLGAVVYSPDGATQAIASRGRLGLWDQASGREIVSVQAHDNIIPGIAFQPNGNLLATSCQDGSVKLWRLRLGDEPSIELDCELEPKDRQPSDRAMSVAFSPQGDILAAPVGNKIFLWDVHERRIRHQLGGHEGEVWSVRFSPDNSVLVSAASGRGAVRRWEVATGATLGEPLPHGTGARAAVFSPDGATIASGGVDNTVKLWDANTGREKKAELTGHTRWVQSLAFHPDGKTLASGSWDRTLRLWALKQLDEPPLILRGFPGFVASIEFSPDGSTLTASDILGEVKLFDVPRTEEPNVLEGHFAAFSKDGTSLLTSVRGGKSRLWDAATCALKFELELPAELGDRRSFSADFSKVATITSTGAVNLWNLRTHEKESLAEKHLSPAEQLLLSPDGKSLATNSGSRLELWDLSTATVSAELDVFVEQRGSFFAAFSPDSASVMTAYEEVPLESFSVRQWDLTGKLIRTFGGHDTPIRAIAFSSGQRVLATASWTDVKIWDVSTGKLQQTLKGYLDTVNSLAFTPDGKRLASAGFDGAIQLWDVSTGEEMIALHGHQGGVVNITFSRTGRTLASAGWDGVVRLWRAE